MAEASVLNFLQTLWAWGKSQSPTHEEWTGYLLDNAVEVGDWVLLGATSYLVVRTLL
jgi:hypothetical protein